MVKRRIVFTSKYKRDYKRLQKRNANFSKLFDLIARLENDGLKASDKDHALKGEYHGYRECHIANDWVLVYEVIGKEVALITMGSHSDIFKKKY